MVEISQEALNAHRQALEAAQQAAQATQRHKALVDKLWFDPELGSAVRNRAKQLYPELQLPEDTVDPILAPLRKENETLKNRLDALEKERADEKKAIEDKKREDIDKDFERKIKQAREHFKLTDEGFDAMIARMKETSNYTDPMAAAAYIVSQNPPVETPSNVLAPGMLDFAGSAVVDPKYKLLHQNPEQYFDNEVRSMLKNPRGYVAQELGEEAARVAFGR